MRLRLVAVAVLAGLASPTVSDADSIARIGPPKNPPPASFAGTQFVDSRGCVYMRAGYDGTVTWVPRIDDAHKVLCGYQPTVIGGTALAVAVPPAVAPAAGPRPVAVLAPPAPPKPVAMSYSGLPLAPAPAPVTVVTVAPAAPPAPVAVPLHIPAGYQAAWKDGRLNPLRAKGTAAGEAQMYSIWSHRAPMRLLPGATTVILPDSAAAVAAPAPHLSTSNSRAAAPAAVAGRYVQVGSFAAPGNARGAASRLLALGLPVATAAGRIGGRPVEVVLAGPFDDPQALGAALSVARGAGFADAFARD